MSLSLQVLYPATGDLTFDFEHYANVHGPLVGEHMGPFIESSRVIKGVAGGPGVPSPFFVVATMTFADQAALDGAMSAAGPVLADIPNFYGGKPTMVIGEVLA